MYVYFLIVLVLIHVKPYVLVLDTVPLQSVDFYFYCLLAFVVVTKHPKFYCGRSPVVLSTLICQQLHSFAIL